jgi:hypothetical protein
MAWKKTGGGPGGGFCYDGGENLKSVYEVFSERGFIEQITDEPQIRELLGMRRSPATSA